MSLTCAACGDGIDRGYIVGQPGTIGAVVCRTCRADGWLPSPTPDPDPEAAALRARLAAAEAEVERLRAACASWADLWAVYMRENRALTARIEALQAEVTP